MVSEIVEDENNFLHDCDLYNDLCTKLMTNLKNNHENRNHQLHISWILVTLKDNLMSILSPYTESNINSSNTDKINHRHKAVLSKPHTITTTESNSPIYRHSYILNWVSTFLICAINKRQKFMSDPK